ncbi:MAG: hypothetical protein J6Q35_04950, partial [Rikenellaceae bacterium]|nr:hypothetical protein [Rikenellaceae bacterium]
MRRVFVVAILVSAFLSSADAFGQSFEEYEKNMNSMFDRFKENTDRQYEEFYKQANAQYADFLKQTWKEFKVEPQIPEPTPNPPVQPIFNPQENKLPQIEVPIIEILPQITLPQAAPSKPRPTPIVPISTINVKFFGVECELRADKIRLELKLADDGEESVSQGWTKLSDGRVGALINDCLE